LFWRGVIPNEIRRCFSFIFPPHLNHVFVFHFRISYS
jgi:hypothetical protein